MITLHDRMLKDLLKNLSNEHGDSKDNAIILIFSVSLLVSELAQAKYVTPKLNSKSKYEKLAVIVRVLHNMQSFHVVFLQKTAKKCAEIYNARAQQLFCSLSLLLGGVFVADGVVVSPNSLHVK